ncbi:uncharacterized protein MKK02DRAFT_41004 [Dioszegia hungarica]|uniref:EamA domain-containing protein n=1 Tax=Dioszegia hungarica TaxID=4972 RepID=A0AA38H233_9TREE|nr:uncharacterized protein MKK02DRAFT_41004 [Dioszegia hungarica]KAI9632695.1 hypothetical protein MKK02DRAFT_41004 [Dioszegia hungarica]
MPPAPESLLRTARRYLVGVGLLLGVVLLWTVSNFITNSLETGEKAWNKPFLITYIDTAGFTVYLIPTLLRYWRGELHSDKRSEAYQPLSQSEDPSNPSNRSARSRSPSASPYRPPRSIDLDSAPLTESQLPGELPKLTIRETAQVAAWWAAVWFAANWAVNASLAWTSVASVTILSSTSGFFTLALGRMVGVESLTRTKFLAVLASFVGVVMVTRSDSTLSSSSSSTLSDLPAHPVLGDLAAILSACFYAKYVILLKKQVGDEDRADMQLMLGFAGLFSTTLLLPLIPILHYLNWEPFELPPTRTAWIICGINMAITLSSDYMYMLAMLKTTPMLATVGLSLTIPLALVGSLFIPSSSPDAITPLSLGGAVLVVSAFGMLGLQGWRESMGSDQASPVDQTEHSGDGQVAV